LNKWDRILDFGWSQYEFLNKNRDKTLIVIGWVTKDSRVGFQYFSLDDFSDKSPNRKSGKSLKLRQDVKYSPEQNPDNYHLISEYQQELQEDDL
jgi:hypothetical protein